MSYTPGPWSWERVGAAHRNQREKGMAFRIEAKNGNGPKRWDVAVGYYKPDWAEAEANARLLAAAPALLAALERIYETACLGNGNCAEIGNIARAALALAKGE